MPFKYLTALEMRFRNIACSLQGGRKKNPKVAQKKNKKYFLNAHAQQIRAFSRKALKSIYPSWFCFRWVLSPDRVIVFVFRNRGNLLTWVRGPQDMRAQEPFRGSGRPDYCLFIIYSSIGFIDFRGRRNNPNVTRNDRTWGSNARSNDATYFVAMTPPVAH